MEEQWDKWAIEQGFELGIHPWDRILGRKSDKYKNAQGESDKAYAEFKKFLTLEPSRRSLHNYWRDFGDGTFYESGVVPGSAPHWCQQWKWFDRARFHDDYQEHQKRLLLEELKQRAIDTHSRLSRALIAKCEQALAAISVDDIDVWGIARLFELAVKIERLSYGMDEKEIKSAADSKEDHREAAQSLIEEAYKLAEERAPKQADGVSDNTDTTNGE